MVAKAMPLVSNTRFRGIPSGSQVFMGSLEFPVPTFGSERMEASSFLPKGVRGGTGPRVDTRFPAQDPNTSWTGAGPPGLGSGFNLFPLYRLSFVPGLALGGLV